jgi:hypothetical protein
MQLKKYFDEIIYMLQDVNKISNNKIQFQFIFQNQHVEEIKNFESLKLVI